MCAWSTPFPPCSDVTHGNPARATRVFRPPKSTEVSKSLYNNHISKFPLALSFGLCYWWLMVRAHVHLPGLWPGKYLFAYFAFNWFQCLPIDNPMKSLQMNLILKMKDFLSDGKATFSRSTSSFSWNLQEKRKVCSSLRRFWSVRPLDNARKSKQKRCKQKVPKLCDSYTCCVILAQCLNEKQNLGQIIIE